jgi:DNA-binding response OmpR family regulator
MRLDEMKRVLIIDDEVLIAFDIQWALSQAGYEVAEIRTTVGDALASIARTDFDIAVLDANLNGESAEPVATALAERGIPFLGLSGYSPGQQPPSFGDAPFLAKPFRADDLIAKLQFLTKAA